MHDIRRERSAVGETAYRTSAIVKWFNRLKDYGFLIREGQDRNVFVRMEIVRRSELGEIDTGDQLQARIAGGGKGPLAVAPTHCELADMTKFSHRVLQCIPLALLLLGCRAEPQSPPNPPPSKEARQTADTVSGEDTVETIAVTIRTADGDRIFDVETAITADEQRRGLMFRESLPENGGMIFPFEFLRFASFWMRNTLIPLDMIFIRADGVIANIARETEPYTLDSYQSAEPVIAVLEIDGGRSAELGIGVGDRVSWAGGPAFPE